MVLYTGLLLDDGLFAEVNGEVISIIGAGRESH